MIVHRDYIRLEPVYYTIDEVYYIPKEETHYLVIQGTNDDEIHSELLAQVNSSNEGLQFVNDIISHRIHSKYRDFVTDKTIVQLIECNLKINDILN